VPNGLRSTPVPHLPDDLIADLAALVESYAAEHHCPSITWGVVGADGLAAWGSTGTLAVGAVQPASEHSVYRIASMTKSFSCAAVLALRDAGALSLADRIADLAPELAGVRGPTADAAPITVGDLMSMASGLPTDDPWADRHLEITDDELDAVVHNGTLFAHSPGTAYVYSNLGFGLLGRVVRRATGRTIQQVVSEQLLGPLGMTRTTWVQPDHDDWARPHRVVDGDIVAEGTHLQGDGGIAPMGGLWTTVADLATWARFLDDAFPPRDDPDEGPLRRATRREMQRIHTFDGPRDLAGERLVMGYGYGLRVGDSPTLGRLVTHAGGLPGFGSNMRWLQGRRLGAIAVSNRTYAPMSELTMRMLQLLARAGLVPHPTPVVSSALDDAARRLVELLGDWNDVRADALLADNVAPDDPYTRRKAAAAHLVEACGGSLVIEGIDPIDAATGVVRLRHPSGTPAQLRVELAPLVPTRIQLYRAELPRAGTDGAGAG
jgi:CubicO group peptidase (beta-lactamase class C family)